MSNGVTTNTHTHTSLLGLSKMKERISLDKREGNYSLNRWTDDDVSALPKVLVEMRKKKFDK